MSYLDIVRHRKRSNLSPDHGNEFRLGGGGEGGAVVHGDKAVESFPLHWVWHWHHSCLSNILVLNQHRFNLVNYYDREIQETSLYMACKWSTLGLHLLCIKPGFDHHLALVLISNIPGQWT